MARRMAENERQEFLAGPHVGVLSVVRGGDRPPLSVPLWYDYEPVATSPSSQGRRVARPGRRVDAESWGVLSLTVQREVFPYKYVTVEGTVVGEERPPSAERMGWKFPWFTTTDDFSEDFDVPEYFGLNVFLRDGGEVFRTYFTSGRAAEAIGPFWSFLDLTPWVGRRHGRTHRKATRRIRCTPGGASTTSTTMRPSRQTGSGGPGRMGPWTPMAPRPARWCSRCPEKS